MALKWESQKINTRNFMQSLVLVKPAIRLCKTAICSQLVVLEASYG